MGIQRRLAQSDEARDKALTQALTKKTTPGPDGNFLTALTDSRLVAIQLAFHEAMTERGGGLAGQVVSTESVVTNKAIAQQHISHYIQVFNLGVARGVYPKAHRAYYLLDVNSEAVPPIGTELEINQWGTRIAEGDALRVAAGGAAMANPTAAQVATAFGNFTTANTAQSGLKDTYDGLQEVVGELRPEADKVIKKIWDEVETFYNEEEPSSMRRKAREWGVVYISDVAITFQLHVTDSVSGLPLEGAQIELSETGNTVLTDSSGNATLVTHLAAEECNLVFTMADYVTSNVNIIFTTDVVYPIGLALVHV